jgi:hypothetical protein
MIHPFFFIFHLLYFTLIKMMIFHHLWLDLFLLWLPCRGLSWGHKTDRLSFLLLECKVVRRSFQHSWGRNCGCGVWFLDTLFFLQEFLEQFRAFDLIKVTWRGWDHSRGLCGVNRSWLDSFLKLKVRLRTLTI